MPHENQHYPIDELTDGDGCQLGWWAKGHYPSEAFAKAIEDEANAYNANPDWWDDDHPKPERIRIPVQSVYRTWWRCVPCSDPDYPGYHEYHVAKPGARGAFRVTVTQHHPWAGWDGRSRRRRGCFCSACRVKSQRYYDELNHLTRRREKLGQWRAAAHPERYRHDVVLHPGTDDDRFNCRYVTWDELDAPHMVAWMERHGITAPTPPEVMSHAA
jgi:hypothetical protein